MRRLAGALGASALLSAAVGAFARAHVPRRGRMRQLPGQRLRVIEAGPADGPATVLIHGLCGQADNFAALWPRLGGRVIAADRPGAGRTPPAAPGGATLAGQAATIAALIEAMGAGPAVIVGHSLGGAVALQLAADRPDLVARVVLCGALSAPLAPALAGFGAALGAAAPLREALARTAGLPVMAALSPWFLHACFAPEPMPPGFLRWGGGMLAGQPRAIAGALRDLDVVARGIGALGPRLAGIRAPLHILHGAEDRVVPVWQSRQLAAAVPGARLQIVEGAGHMLPVTRPALVAAAC